MILKVGMRGRPMSQLKTNKKSPNRKWSFCALSAAGLALWASFPVLAQEADPDPNVPVTARPRPDYDPFRLHVGSFSVLPEITVGGIYDDNILADKDDKLSDFGMVISPEINAQSRSSSHQLNLDVGADLTRYQTYTRQNTDTFYAQGDGRLDITRDWDVSGLVRAARLADPAEDPEEAGANEPILYNTLTTNVALNRTFDLLRFSVGLGFLRYDYDKTEGIDGNDRDRNEYDQTFRISFAQSPRLVYFVGTEIQYQQYDVNRDDNGFERDRTQYGINTGIDVNITSVLFGEVAVGVARAVFKDSEFDAKNAFTFSSNLTWNVTPTTTLKLDAERDFGSTTQDGSAVNLRTVVGLSADHELRRNVLIGAGVGYLRSEFEDTGITDDEIFSEARVRYLLNRRFSIDGRYRFSTRSSSDSDRDFDRNQILISLTARL